MSERYDLIVIGAGPGGYPAAIAAAKLGKRTAIVEKEELGGTCLNRGCIPTKTLLHTSHLFYQLKNAEKIGIKAAQAILDPGRLKERKEEVVLSLREGIGRQLRQHKIEVFRGTGRISGPHEVAVKCKGGEAFSLTADCILAAVGSVPAIPPIPGAELPGVVDSDALLDRSEEPYKRLVIIGGGVIGMEFATLYSDFGSQVTVLEAMDRILPGMDKEISQNLKMIMKKRGADIHAGARVKKIERREGTLYCSYEEKDEEKVIPADGILIATGRRGNTQGLFAPRLEPSMNGSSIVVDEQFRTTVPGVYAIGDAIGGIQLAHMATAEGEEAVARMFGTEPLQNLQIVPSCVYTNPEIACVGVTAEEARAAGIEAGVGKYIMSVNGRSLLSLEERGFIKIVARKEDGKIIGAQMMCARATDLIGEMGLAIAKGLTMEDVAGVIMAHPTFSEGIGEAAKAQLS